MTETQKISKPTDETRTNLIEEEDIKNYRYFQSNYLNYLVSAIAIIWAVFQVYTGVFGLLPALVQRSFALGFALLLVFLRYRTKIHNHNDRKKWPILDIIFFSLAFLTTAYLFFNFKTLPYRAGMPTQWDIVFGIIFTLLVFEGTRRTAGIPLVIVAGVFVLYAFVGSYIPGPLGHRGYSLARVINHLYCGTSGLFGVPMYVMTTYVFSFILFGSFLEATGGAKRFMQIAYALTGSSKGGPAKTAVLSSALMGTISGSSLANVVTTGSFTIPLMKKIGYKPSFAGGVEAASSSGGQIMPPVMGAAAFIMAEMIGVPYISLVKAASIPAILYFASVFLMVHFEASKMGLKAIPREELPDLKQSFYQALPLLFPIGAIITLLCLGYSPLKAALYSTLLMVIVSSFSKDTRLTFKDFVKAFETASFNSITVSLACGICGAIVGMVSLTGIGVKLADVIIAVSHGHLFPLLVLTMIASIILGMGLPTTAKYIVLATVAAPALVKLGVPLIASHLFIFYFGVIAEVTPPVALTSYAAAAVAKAPSVETAIEGLKISFAAFLVPFLFVYSPVLLLHEVTAFKFILTMITASLGIVSLAGAMVGYLFSECSLIQRVLLMAGSVSLIFYGFATDLFGIGVLLFVLFLQKGQANKKLTQREVV